ncbi:MAG: ECF RNA polymerase sigma factor SigW [Candidatus Izimaplasma bacterium HR2]|nr:MAG: ECF RNA polymerase sigma factor SigW [Candidatus Izimaplasma bacterium HR2]
MSNSDIKILVKQLQNGDMSVFDDLYYQTKDIVFYSILGILKDYSISEDIMQDTYLKALSKIHSYKPTHSFKSWIVTIAKNLAINEFNRRKRETTIDIQTDEMFLGQTESRSENQILIEQIFKVLNDTEREIVLLHVVGDLKHREIAKMLNKPLGTITWAYKNSLEKLKKELNESR